MKLNTAFAMDPIPFYWNSYEAPVLGLTPQFEGRHFNLIHGEEEIVEGIRAYPTPGHSPGHMAVSVQTEKGVYSLIGDAVLLREVLFPQRRKKVGRSLLPGDSTTLLRHGAAWRKSYAGPTIF